MNQPPKKIPAMYLAEFCAECKKQTAHEVSCGIHTCKACGKVTDKRL